MIECVRFCRLCCWPFFIRCLISSPPPRHWLHSDVSGNDWYSGSLSPPPKITGFPGCQKKLTRDPNFNLSFLMDGIQVWAAFIDPEILLQGKENIFLRWFISVVLFYYLGLQTNIFIRRQKGDAAGRAAWPLDSAGWEVLDLRPTDSRTEDYGWDVLPCRGLLIFDI